MLTLVACWFALSQLVLVLYVVETANRATLMPGTTNSMMAYLVSPLADTRIDAIQDRISVMDEVSRVEYIPRRQGLARMKQWLGPDNPLIDGLDPEVLPDALEIRIRRKHSGEMQSIAAGLLAIEEIEDVRYSRGIIGHIAGSFRIICIVSALITLIVVICLSLVIFLSIRVGIAARAREVEVMSLLGADGFFLYAPYLIEACLYGIIGSLLALGSTQVVINSLLGRVPVFLSLVMPLNIHHIIEVIFFACLCSITAAVLAIRGSRHV